MALETIKLKDLIRAGQKELLVQETYEYEDLPLKEPVQVQAQIRLNTTGVTVLGKFKAVVEEPCDRCYEPFERTLQNSFEERYVYESFIDLAPPSERELRSEDFYETLEPEGDLDLKDLVHQHIILAMSADRICERETCEVRF